MRKNNFRALYVTRRDIFYQLATEYHEARRQEKVESSEIRMIAPNYWEEVQRSMRLINRLNYPNYPAV